MATSSHQNVMKKEIRIPVNTYGKILRNDEFFHHWEETRLYEVEDLLSCISLLVKEIASALKFQTSLQIENGIKSRVC